MTLRREVLWSGSLGSAPLADRVRAAAAHGYSQLSLWIDDLEQVLAEPARPSVEVDRAGDVGVGLDIVDGILEWYPHVAPRAAIEHAGASVDQVLTVCEAFGATTLCAAAIHRPTLDFDGLVEHFAALCDAAAERGVRVGLEFLPFPPFGDIATAWRLVAAVGRPNAGILFDTWHFFHGTPDFDDLAAVPGDRIFGVQVNDGTNTFVESLVKDSLRHRLLPGTGRFDLCRALRVLDAIGGLRLAGPEVFSVELHALPVEEAARLAADHFDRVAAQIGTVTDG